MPLTENQLLASLPSELAPRVRALLHPVEVCRGSTIYAPDQCIDEIYFPRKGIAGVLWPHSAASVDIAMVGSEGMLGCPVSFGAAKAIFRTIARSDLSAGCMKTAEFERLVRECPDFQAAVVGCAARLTKQIAETAFVNARLRVEERVARWLCLASERLNSSVLKFTHDELASAVGCRRAGVTVALHILEGEKILRSTRSKIVILDGDRLKAAGSEDKKNDLGQIASRYDMMP